MIERSHLIRFHQGRTQILGVTLFEKLRKTPQPNFLVWQRLAKLTGKLITTQGKQW
jgi:hypothetical protein